MKREQSYVVKFSEGFLSEVNEHECSLSENISAAFKFDTVTRSNAAGLLAQSFMGFSEETSYEIIRITTEYAKVM